MFNIEKILYLLFLSLFSINVFSAEKFNWHCTETECNLYAIANNGKEFLASSGWTTHYPGRSSFKYFNSNLGEASLGCGTSCIYSIFIDFDKKLSSEIYWNVLAVNSEKNVIVIPDEE